jgi:hypothetical protein
VPERLDRELAAHRRWHAAVGERGEHGLVVDGIHYDRDVFMVFGRRAQHRGAADVDVLDRLGVRAIGTRRSGLEWIQVHDE